MELYFLRHAIAADRDDPKYKDDSLRPLTRDGQKRMLDATSGMKALKLNFDVILSSPYLRARQTAQIVAQVYKINHDHIHLTKNLLPPTGIKILLNEIQSTFPKAKHLLLVGHEPHLSIMISELLDSVTPLNIDFKKGGLCHVNVLQPTGHAIGSLKWLLTPSQLKMFNPGF